MQKKQILINGHLVTYYVLNEDNKSKYSLIFLHGWRSDSQAWLPLLEHLKKISLPIYIVDLPGFGLSENPKQPFSMDDYRDIVVNFVDKLTLKNVILLGHSFGGRVSIKIASGVYSFLKKIVLIDSAGVREEENKKKLFKMAAKTVKPIFALPFLSKFKQKIYSMMGAEDYTATPALRETFINIVGENLTPLLPQIICPTLIIWGENDIDTPLSQFEIMKKNIPHAKTLLLKNAGHFSFQDKPKECAESIIQFIEG